MKVAYENYSIDVFPGFYETGLWNSDMFDYWTCKDGFYMDFKTGGFLAYKKEICEEWISEMQKQIKGNPTGLKIIGFKDVKSPKEYNLYTDTIKMGISVDLRKLKKFCFADNAENFGKYLSENWTSQSGFISFIPNSLEEFSYSYKANPSDKEYLINVMIEFFLLESIDFNKVECSVREDECERLDGKLELVKSDDNSKWDYEYSNETYEYIPTEKVAQEE